MTTPHDPTRKMTRRTLLGGLAITAGAAAVPTSGLRLDAASKAILDQDQTPEPIGKPAPQSDGKAVKNGRLKQSLCFWCMGMSLEELSLLAVRFGVPSIEILTTDKFPTIQKHGLVCAMTHLPGPAVINKGLNRIEHHESYLARMRASIDATAEAGFPNVICFSGNRDGMSDDEGLANCVTGIKKIVGHAEKRGVTLCMELLNSKDHKDYMCDKTTWGVELVKQVGSDRFKLLYDIFHMQRMEGDVINTIRQYKDYIGHYHTAGNPGRSNLDDTQELQYGPICKAILETGYTGYLGQEFRPRGGEKAIRQAIELCDV